MDKPVIADRKPIFIELEAGKKYHWCACGKSANQPFCDGSHKGSGIAPKAFEAGETKKYALCACKHTGSSPFCDGSHKSLE